VAPALKDLASTASQVTDPQVLWIPFDTEAFAAFAEGRLADAGQTWRDGARRYKTRAHDLLYMAATTALLLGDAPAAARDLAELDAIGLRAPLIAARRTVLRAGLAALAGNADESADMFDAALRQVRALSLPFEEASIAIVMATVLDPETPEVRTAAQAAHEVLTRLGAQPFLNLLQRRIEANGRDRATQDHPALSTQAVAMDLGTSA
jgi:hypothetical protein